MFRSWKIIFPWVGCRCPVMRLNMVDFPAPLGPIIQAICPWTTVRSTSWTATNPSKDLVTFSTRSSILCVLSRSRGDVQGSTVGLTKRLADFSLPEVIVDEHGPQHNDHQTGQRRMQCNMQRQGQQREDQKYDPPELRKRVELPQHPGTE